MLLFDFLRFNFFGIILRMMFNFNIFIIVYKYIDCRILFIYKE